MKIEKNLIDFIEENLGNLDEGTSILFICDSFTLKDAVNLCGLITLNFLEQGGGCIIVGTILPFSMIFDYIENRFVPESLPLIQKGLEEGRSYYIDAVSKDYFQEAPAGFKGASIIDNNPNRIIYEIHLLRDQIKKSFIDIPVMISYQNFSSSIIDFGSESVLKMYRKLTANVKLNGDLINGVVNRDLHDAQVINTLIHFSDFVLELCSEEKGGMKQPYMQILKSPILEPNRTYLQQSYAYLLSDNNFFKIHSQAPDFNELKRNISHDENGALLIYDTEYLITPLNTYLVLFKELEKNLGIKEYRELVKNFGKSLGFEIINLLKSKYNIEGNELLERAINYFLIQGWGKLIKREGSLESGRLQLSFLSTLAHNYGAADHPVCVMGEGILSAMLEGTTGNKWNCRETNCIAIGDELCVFEAKVEK